MSNEVLMSQFANTLGLVGGLSKAFATVQYGNEAAAAAKFRADQLRQQGGQAEASAERAAFFENRNTEYVMSDALAKAAASGGGASDPTIINLMAKMAQEGAYRQQVALYQGDEKDRSLNLEADATMYEGAQRKRAGELAGIAGLFQVGAQYVRGEALTLKRQAGNLLASNQTDSSLYQRFSGDGPPQASRWGF